MRRTRLFFSDLYFLAAPYFKSTEWRSAWALVTVLVAVSLMQTGLAIVISFSQSIFYTALQQRDSTRFLRGLFWFTPRGSALAMPPFVALVMLNIGLAAFASYTQSWLQIRWQRWMTAHLVTRWLSNRAYYRMMVAQSSQAAGTDNPDQRIQEDVEDVTRNSIDLSIGLLGACGTLVTYGGLLWSLSGHFTILGVGIPGYLLWSALIYAAVCTLITHLVGSRLASLQFTQQRFRGNFRFSLFKTRENAEAIALLRGEAQEQEGLSRRFADFYDNFLRIISRTAFLKFLGLNFEQSSIIFPTVIAAPRFFAGEITFGTLNQIRLGFLSLSEATLWFVTSYANLAAFVAQTERLATFQRALQEATAMRDDIVMEPSVSGELAMDQMTLAAPDGRTLLRTNAIKLAAGTSVAIMGPSGCGKSTLFRAIAGIWPFGTGIIAGPDATSLCLPQKPYLPEGTLRRIMCYPRDRASVADEVLRVVLEKAGLGGLAAELDNDAPWSQRLSPGEQQRIGIVRAVLLAPSWLFLDEATSSLDEASQQALYAMLRRELPDTTLVSITHDPGLARTHDRVLVVQNGMLLDAASGSSGPHELIA